MKNNLNEQTSNIKRLMLLNEQCGSDLDQCEEDLEEKGYDVFNPIEIKSSCKGKPFVYEIKKMMKDGGVNDNQIAGVKESQVNAPHCFVMYMNPTKYRWSGESFSKFNWTFYSNGQVSMIETLNPSDPHIVVDGTDTIFQYQYDGMFEIIDPNKIKIYNFDYCCSFYDGVTKKNVNPPLYEIPDGGGKIAVDQVYPTTFNVKFNSGRITM